MTSEAEARRLEGLWRGEFGDGYVRRNADLDDRRGVFWAELLGDFEVASALEVGCGQGGNLRHLAAILPPGAVWGVDVNDEARVRARRNAPGTNVVAAVARALPFRDGLFDLALTVGVLIHQPDTTLPLVRRSSSGSAGATSCGPSTTRTRRRRCPTTASAAPC